MELTTFSIPTFRKEMIKTRLEKLARKAVKYGNSDITFSFGSPYIREIRTDEGKRKVEYVDISVQGEAPKIAGWQLLGRIELMNGENLIHSVPGVEGQQLGEEYRHHDGFCEHCNSHRRRNDVYILTDGGAYQIAVGRTCLRDFLGIDDPKAIVSRAQFFEELRNFQEEDEFGSLKAFGAYSLHELLTVAAAYVRTRGYVSKGMSIETGDETTSQSVKATLDGARGYEIEHTDADVEWKDKTIAFFRDAEEFGNNYLDNIRILMKEDIVLARHIPLVASAVITTQRELARKEKKEDAPESNFVGQVKERLRDLEVTLDKIIFLGDGHFGPSFLHIFQDENGNVFTWITGNKIEEAEGTKLKLDATVKQHKVYNDVKQTVLTRAKVKE